MTRSMRVPTCLLQVLRACFSQHGDAFALTQIYLFSKISLNSIRLVKIDLISLKMKKNKDLISSSNLPFYHVGWHHLLSDVFVGATPA